LPWLLLARWLSSECCICNFLINQQAKPEMIARGISVDEIERVLAAKSIDSKKS
jgi:hypothetical protein